MSGFVVYEAAAASKPIVAFHVEWHSEFIENERTGLLVKNRDVVALAEAVERMLTSPSWALELGRKARERLDRMYDPRVTVEAEIAAYKSLLEGQK
jgi:glycosyltransferase involved in cell wall biosynthesis